MRLISAEIYFVLNCVEEKPEYKKSSEVIYMCTVWDISKIC